MFQFLMMLLFLPLLFFFLVPPLKDGRDLLPLDLEHLLVSLNIILEGLILAVVVLANGLIFIQNKINLLLDVLGQFLRHLTPTPLQQL